MAASPGAPEASPPPSPVVEAGTPPPPEEPVQNRCRLCAKDTTDWVDIFGENGKQRGLPEKVRLCLPVLVSNTIFLSTVTICIHKPSHPVCFDSNFSNSLKKDFTAMNAA